MSSVIGNTSSSHSSGDTSFEAMYDQQQMRILAPAMPPGIKALIHEEYEQFDPEASNMLGWIQKSHVFHEFAHCRDPFHVHLRNTWAILCCWAQPRDVCRMGLFHSAYTREGFFFRLLNMQDAESRGVLCGVIGKGAERLVYNYCAPELPFHVAEHLGDEHAQLANGDGTMRFPIRLGRELDKPFYDIPSRVNPEEIIRLDRKDVAKYFVVFVADIVEQMSSIMTYRDIYHEAHPSLLWPGPGVPGMGFHFFSRMLFSARPYLDVVPPVFNHCTEILSAEDELEASTSYWSGMQQLPHGLFTGDIQKPEDLEALFLKATQKNPWVAEPHVMLSQLFFKRELFAQAVHHAACALERFYQWGTCWDKRYTFAQWVGFTRMMLLRAKRCEQGLKVLPSEMLSPATREGSQEVTYLQDLLKDFDRFTDTSVSSSIVSQTTSRL